MLIAVSADGRSLSSAVSETFESCRFLLLVETDDSSVEVIENGGDGDALAKIVVSRDCEAVITGEFSIDTFSILANAGITRYKGSGNTVKQALLLMDKNTLEYIRYASENDSCSGDHSGGACNCEEHD